MRYCYLNNNISGVVFAFLFLFFVFIVSHQCCYSIFSFFPFICYGIFCTVYLE